MKKRSRIIPVLCTLLVATFLFGTVSATNISMIGNTVTEPPLTQEELEGYYFNTSTDFKTITICDPHPTYSGTYTYTLEEMETAVESSNGYYNRLDASTV